MKPPPPIWPPTSEGPEMHFDHVYAVRRVNPLLTRRSNFTCSELELEGPFDLSPATARWKNWLGRRELMDGLQLVVVVLEQVLRNPLSRVIG
jgi:hypothetical protein